MRGCAVVDHSKVELLACPFCGEYEIVRTEVWSGFHAKWVDTRECKCCGAAAPVEVWNRRYTDPAQTAPQVEQSGLVEALRRIANSGAQHVEQNQRPDLVTVAHWVGVADAALSAQGGEA